ncbi:MULTISPECIES: putative bifunctional diguanylate cyclase/phosphodiesterase [Niveibacterium]|uniref:EAL domain-containing protein n=1 Tax=Niveibacterium microcysteis TaxID=2811415 RepID=A0ABX7M8T9_9RHOO|nr:MULTISPECIES: EAL domain-containing protein [Niveibacterium]QSI76885.1 EAL domain-containing protein [Niveibacterium microcysteis]
MAKPYLPFPLAVRPMGIAAKLSLLAVSTILLTAVAIGVAVIRTQSKLAFDALKGHGEAVVSMLAQSGEFPLYSANRPALTQMLGGLADNKDIAYAAFYGADHTLLVERRFRSSAPARVKPADWPARGVSHRSLGGDQLEFLAVVKPPARVPDEDDGEAFVGAPDDAPLGYVQLTLSSARAKGEALSFINETARFAIVVTALAIVLTTLFTRRLVQPLRDLSRAAREVAEGRLGQTVQISSTDELADLGRAFQHMVDSLGASRARLLEYQNLLEDRVQSRTRELEQATAQALDLAQRDTLTGLPNRAHFTAMLEQALVAHASSGERIAVLFLDLDLFKRINDTLGHQTGDTLLQHIAEALRGALRDGDLVARFGGDEFVILARDVRNTEQVSGIARRILNAFLTPVELAGHSFKVGFSIGISICPDHGNDAANLLKNADLAMYASKEAGRGGYRFYTPDLNQRAMDRLNIENGLRRALDNEGELILEYQPQVELNGGRMVSAEALLRWKTPEGTVISPGRFIPIAEETGLIVPIGEKVLRNACATLARWRAAGLPLPRIAVNIAAPQFESRNFGDTVARALADYNVPPDRLELELTESVIVRDAESALREMARLKELGVSIALDDFGTGYSSLSYLSRMPIDLVKIDRAFVMRSTDDDNARTIVRSIVALSHALRHKVVAEGVETRAQLTQLRRAGCDYVQGFLLARPMSEAALTAWLSSEVTPAEALLGDKANEWI